jgi:hypothetical protein
VRAPRVLATLLVLAAVGASAGCGSSGSPAAGTGPVGPASTGDGDGAAAVGDGASDRLTAELTGSAVVPGPGDPDGGGQTTVVVDSGSSQLCYRIDAHGITDPVGAALHEGSVDRTGDVVLGLDPPAGGRAEGCVTADPPLLDRMGQEPERYYVTVRNDEFQDAALRGQLARQ